MMIEDKGESDTSLTNEDEDMDLFHSYYGIASSPRPEGVDPMSLDSSEFQTTEYVVSELQNLKVGELLDKDADLMHDIRNLDSDMQMLVYENYNKFIAATETIKRMKNNVEDMDTDMSSIDANMQRIFSGSSQLDGSLAGKRNKVEKLVRVHRLLERLQFLSGLPEKLTSMVERESFKDAVQLYKTSSRILQQYSHVLSFSNIEKECITIMDSLQTLLQEKLSEPSLGFEKRASYIGVLRAIVGDDKAKELAVDKKLLSLQSNRIYMLIDMLDSIKVAGKEDGIQISTVQNLYHLVAMNLVESAHITFAMNPKENENGDKDLTKILIESISSTVGRLRKSLCAILEIIFAVSTKDDEDDDVVKMAQSKRKEECMEFLKRAVMDMSYLYSYIEKASSANGSSPIPSWHKDLTQDFVSFVQVHLDSFMDQCFESISVTIAQSSKAIENFLLSANLFKITDNIRSDAGKVGNVNKLEGAEIQVSISDSLKSNISTIATKAAPKIKDIVDVTLSSFEIMMSKVRPLYELYKVMNFGAVEQSQRCLVDFIFGFFDRLVKVVTNSSIGHEQPFFCVDIYANIFTEQGLHNTDSTAIHATRVVCASYLRELTVIMSPQVLSYLEKSQYFHLTSQSSEITKDLMKGMHKINERLLRNATFLTIDYVESVASRMAKLLTDEGNIEQNSVNKATMYELGGGAIAAAMELDHAMLTLCTFLGIVPPTVYSKTVIVAEVGAPKRQNPSRQQIDIDKLFADPVTMMPLMVNDRDAMPFSKFDAAADFSRPSRRQQLEQDGSESEMTSLGCLIAKIALKSSIEILRSRAFLSVGISSQLRGDIALLRIIFEALIDDIEDVYALADLYEAAIDEKTVVIE